MKKYLSTEKDWFEATTAILELDGKPIRIMKHPDELVMGRVHVERVAEKCQVQIEQYPLSDIPCRDRSAEPVAPVVLQLPQIEFLTRDAVSLICRPGKMEGQLEEELSLDLSL